MNHHTHQQNEEILKLTKLYSLNEKFTEETYKANQASEAYTLLKYKNDYKSKKDRKTGEIVDEWWIVEITKGYEVV